MGRAEGLRFLSAADLNTTVLADRPFEHPKDFPLPVLTGFFIISWGSPAIKAASERSSSDACFPK